MMNKIQKTAVSLLLNYISDNPMEKLPKMLDIAEKLDRGNLHADYINALRKICLLYTSRCV